MQPSCITGNEIISICLVETYHVFLLSLRQDPIPYTYSWQNCSYFKPKLHRSKLIKGYFCNTIKSIHVVEKVKRLVFIFTPFRIHSLSSIFFGNVCQNLSMFGRVLQGYFYTFSPICLHF